MKSYMSFLLDPSKDYPFPTDIVSFRGVLEWFSTETDSDARPACDDHKNIYGHVNMLTSDPEQPLYGEVLPNQHPCQYPAITAHQIHGMSFVLASSNKNAHIRMKNLFSAYASPTALACMIEEQDDQGWTFIQGTCPVLNTHVPLRLNVKLQRGPQTSYTIVAARLEVTPEVYKQYCSVLRE